MEQRLTGSSHISIWHGRMRWGGGKYFMGSALYYVAAVSLYRMFERPFFVGGLGILWGYLRARLQGKPRLTEKTYLRALRSFERESLVLGKNRALARTTVTPFRSPSHVFGDDPAPARAKLTS